MERSKVHSIYGRTKNLLRRLHLMGLIEGCKMFLETVGLTMWQMGLN
jgi:Fe2+ transport system protein FeoA